MSAKDCTYTSAGGMIYGGMAAPALIDPTTTPFPEDFTATPTITSLGGDPTGTGPFPTVFEMHGSGGFNTQNGQQFRMPVTGRMSYPGYEEIGFSTCFAGDGANGYYITIRPQDVFGTYPIVGNHRESFFAGFSNMGTPDVHLIGVRINDAIYRYVVARLGNTQLTRFMVATGGSMGAAACVTWAIKRPLWFAAVYADRGRMRTARDGGAIVPVWDTGIRTKLRADAPNIAPEDGGGNFFDWQDGIRHVNRSDLRLPWIGLIFAKQDNDYPVSDYVEVIAALRARKSGFAVSWNNGGHTTGPGIGPICLSYPYGTFEIGKSFPYFSEHSLDKDPLVDDEGMINGGLTFDRLTLIDTPTMWQCRVKHITTACTVKVEPCYPVNFPAGAAAQLVTLPANTWVTVTFNA